MYLQNDMVEKLSRLKSGYFRKLHMIYNIEKVFEALSSATFSEKLSNDFCPLLV